MAGAAGSLGAHEFYFFDFALQIRHGFVLVAGLLQRSNQFGALLRHDSHVGTLDQEARGLDEQIHALSRFLNLFLLPGLRILEDLDQNGGEQTQILGQRLFGLLRVTRPNETPKYFYCLHALVICASAFSFRFPFLRPLNQEALQKRLGDRPSQLGALLNQVLEELCVQPRGVRAAAA